MAGSSRTWYENGLKFQCQPGCVSCCGGAPGYVWVGADEQQALADQLELPLDDFRQKYVRRLSDGDSLRERKSYDCIFLDREIPGCGVYEARPGQCKTFPFWPENLVSKRAWEELKAECPGIGRGRLWTKEEIERTMQTIHGTGTFSV